MIILPAIDIKDGQCVRLYQGDYNQITTYDSDPVQVALRWQRAGATWLHVVDLDGAAQGRPINDQLIGRICSSTTLQIEVGGGLRALEHIERILSLGVKRVVLGTAVLTNRALLESALERWGEQIVVGIDARNGLVAISGWRELSEIKATRLAEELTQQGVARFVYTDIARDGTLIGPNYQALKEMQQATSSKLIASGGVHALEDLHELKRLGVEGVIIGKALYTGAVDLAQALQEIEER